MIFSQQHVGADGNEDGEAKEKEAGKVPPNQFEESFGQVVHKSDASTDTESQSYDELFVRVSLLIHPLEYI